MLLLSLVAVLAAQADPPRGPDAHDLRRQRGDVVVVHGQEPALHGRYVAPVPGWKYSILRPGQRLRSAFLGLRYVIADPARYRLSATSADRRWIRYGDDAVLVGTRKSRVIAVVRDRFR